MWASRMWCCLIPEVNGPTRATLAVQGGLLGPGPLVHRTLHVCTWLFMGPWDARDWIQGLALTKGLSLIPALLLLYPTYNSFVKKKKAVFFRNKTKPVSKLAKWVNSFVWLLLGHIQWHVTPGPTFKNLSWQVWGTVWVAGNQTWLSPGSPTCKANTLLLSYFSGPQSGYILSLLLDFMNLDQLSLKLWGKGHNSF